MPDDQDHQDDRGRAAVTRRAARPGLRELAEKLVADAKACGSDEVEVTISDGYEFNVDVRKGRIEHLVEAGSRVCGMRVIKDRKTAFASSSDLSPATLRRLVRHAVKRAEVASPDEFAGLAPLAGETVDPARLDLYDPAVPLLEPKKKIGLALETERIALEDKRITNSYGSSFGTNEIRSVLANSNGFVGEYAETYCGLSVGLQAGGTDNAVEDSWFSSKRHFGDLARPEDVARRAVERTLRQLRPRKIRTQTVPVIFEPTQTAWLMGFLFSCVSGTAVYRKASFLAGRLGERIGNDLVTVIDDGLMPGGLGTRPFDSDGVPSRRTRVVAQGVLESYLCNVYAARKLGLRTTGSAAGSGVGPSNFYLAPGPATPGEIVASTRRGLILIRTLGHGLNSVSGDISRGAFGLWVEDGRVVYPVSEITISGNLGQLLGGIDAVGSDLEFLGPVAGPTIRVAEMTVAGN
jgi:PmbA protein